MSLQDESDEMPARDRAAGVGGLLARGLLRLQKRAALAPESAISDPCGGSQKDLESGRTALDLSATESVHVHTG